MYEFTVYRGVISHDNQEGCKILRGIDLSVQNWHDELGEFWPEHSEISKFEGKLAGAFKIDMKIWEIFVSKMKNSNFILDNKMTELNQNKN